MLTETNNKSIDEVFKEHFDKNYKDCLFRYRTTDHKNLENLAEDKLYFSTPDHFNDPYDTLIFANPNEIISHIYNNIEIGMDNYIQELKQTNLFAALVGNAALCGRNKEKILDEHFKNIESYVNGAKSLLRKNFRMICFSEIYDSMLMWSHYAGDHKGFVLIYDKEELKNALRYDSDGNLLKNKTILSKVEYIHRQVDLTEEVENFIRYNVLENMGDIESIDGSIGQRKIRQAILQKADEWSYEREWRLVSRKVSFDEPSPLSYIVCRPKGVILGSHCFDEDLDKINKVLKRKNIKIYRMFLSQYEPTFKLYVGRDK